ETMSGLPSRLISVTAQVSFEPRSRVCFSKAISGVRTMLHAASAAASNKATAIQCRVMRTILPLLLAAATAQGAIRFRAQEIQRDFGVVYAVLTADINNDGKPDIVAINPTQVVWFENPTWTKHVILDGVTRKDNVCIAAHDIDGDGNLDLALGADWQPSNTSSGGSLQWIGRNPKDPNAPWRMTPITDEPTLHRIRWGDVDGDGKA